MKMLASTLLEVWLAISKNEGLQAGAARLLAAAMRTVKYSRWKAQQLPL